MMTRELALCLILATTASVSAAEESESFYGTLEPFASEAVYFVLTDRFVNGDTRNDQRDQGGAFPTFDRPTPGGPEGQTDNVGYLGGDFRGVLDHADYIREMGFSSVWITPIIDNPDEAFTGGEPVVWGGMFTDRGKTGYHGYWGVNFWKVDEHLPSANLGFPEFTARMRERGLKTVLDIVANHGSPSFTMPVDQPGYGEVYGRDGQLLADHQNLLPEQLRPDQEPLHAFFHAKQDLVQLSNFDEQNPAVVDYLVDTYLHWIDQGAAAFRIDTIRHVPMPFWQTFTQRIRAKHPGFFMFGEAFDYKAKNIAPFTHPDQAGVSVLDFPLKKALDEVFSRTEGDFKRLRKPLYLTRGPYANPYDLMTFYDNHDMARMDADDEGFIDAHNWLFTARGIPVIYYGSESGFMRGTAEHAGNRNYFGTQGIRDAMNHPIRVNLARVARVRAATPALQRGLQVNLELKGDRAAFLRVLQHDGVAQTALVLLNKGDTATTFDLKRGLQTGVWRDALASDESATLAVSGRIKIEVPAHGLRVFVLDAPVSDRALRSQLRRAMRHKNGG
ncbi:MAG: cyclomaltodextrin glucanotransferase [Ahniella sp.]|nr:cyclomaltodextrin glucanotransferase [Ahniella sp.]